MSVCFGCTKPNKVDIIFIENPDDFEDDINDLNEDDVDILKEKLSFKELIKVHRDFLTENGHQDINDSYYEDSTGELRKKEPEIIVQDIKEGRLLKLFKHLKFWNFFLKNNDRGPSSSSVYPSTNDINTVEERKIKDLDQSLKMQKKQMDFKKAAKIQRVFGRMSKKEIIPQPAKSKKTTFKGIGNRMLLLSTIKPHTKEHKTGRMKAFLNVSRAFDIITFKKEIKPIKEEAEEPGVTAKGKFTFKRLSKLNYLLGNTRKKAIEIKKELSIDLEEEADAFEDEPDDHFFGSNLPLIKIVQNINLEKNNILIEVENEPLKDKPTIDLPIPIPEEIEKSDKKKDKNKYKGINKKITQSKRFLKSPEPQLDDNKLEKSRSPSLLSLSVSNSKNNSRNTSRNTSPLPSPKEKYKSLLASPTFTFATSKVNSVQNQNVPPINTTAITTERVKTLEKERIYGSKSKININNTDEKNLKSTKESNQNEIKVNGNIKIDNKNKREPIKKNILSQQTIIQSEGQVQNAISEEKNNNTKSLVKENTNRVTKTYESSTIIEKRSSFKTNGAGKNSSMGGGKLLNRVGRFTTFVQKWKLRGHCKWLKSQIAIIESVVDECIDIRMKAEEDLIEIIPVSLCLLPKEDIPDPIINLIRTLRFNPPRTLQLLLASICILKGIEPDIIYGDAGQKVVKVDYFKPSKSLLASNFAEVLNDMKRPGDIKKNGLDEFSELIKTNPSFDRVKIQRAFSPCILLYDWILQMEKYGKVAIIVKEKEDIVLISQITQIKASSTLSSLKKRFETIEEKLFTFS